MSRNFRYWLRMLARLADEPLKLSAARLAEKRAAAFSLTTRGWALLAGETSHGDTGERLEAEVIEAFNKLMLDRKLPRGRREGFVSEHTAQVDRVIRAELDAGSSLRSAVRKVSPKHTRDKDRRRQQRRRQRARKLHKL